MIEFIKKTYPDDGIIVTGDFNGDENEASMMYFQMSSKLKSSMNNLISFKN